MDRPPNASRRGYPVRSLSNHYLQHVPDEDMVVFHRQYNPFLNMFRRPNDRNTYMRLSDDPGTTRHFEGGNIKSVREFISKRHNVDASLVDIVSLEEGIVYDDSSALQGLEKPLRIVIHPKERSAPKALQTKDEDITGYGDEPRVKMSCGHAITPENLFGYFNVEVLQRCNYEVRCFARVKKEDESIEEVCNRNWDFQEISECSQLNDDERIFFESKIAINFMRKNSSADIAECPKCLSVCQRVEKANTRVLCIICKRRRGEKYEFCWICKQNWESNHECDPSEIQNILSNCERKQIGYSNQRGVPSIRACPKCYTLISHERDCKQMRCCACGNSFCFVCLKIWNKCNGSFASCEIAPIQSAKTPSIARRRFDTLMHLDPSRVLALDD